MPVKTVEMGRISESTSKNFLIGYAQDWCDKIVQQSNYPWRYKAEAWIELTTDEVNYDPIPFEDNL